MPGNATNPGNSDDSFDFVGTESGPEYTLGDLTSFAILEADFEQGPHASGQDNPREGLSNIFPGQQGDIFETVDFLLADPMFDGI